MLAFRGHASDFVPFFEIEDSKFESGLDGLNWYLYVGNNPLVYVDPTGLGAILWRDIYVFKGWKRALLKHHGVWFQGNKYTYVRQYGTNRTWEDKYPIKNETYHVIYSNLDDSILCRASNKILNDEEWSGGHKDNEDYDNFKHNCQDYAKAVIKEYKSMYKDTLREKYFKDEKNMTLKDKMKAKIKMYIEYKSHLHEIKKDAEKEVKLELNGTKLEGAEVKNKKGQKVKTGKKIKI